MREGEYWRLAGLLEPACNTFEPLATYVSLEISCEQCKVFGSVANRDHEAPFMAKGWTRAERGQNYCTANFPIPKVRFSECWINGDIGLWEQMSVDQSDLLSSGIFICFSR